MSFIFSHLVVFVFFSFDVFFDKLRELPFLPARQVEPKLVISGEESFPALRPSSQGEKTSVAARPVLFVSQGFDFSFPKPR